MRGGAGATASAGTGLCGVSEAGEGRGRPGGGVRRGVEGRSGEGRGGERGRGDLPLQVRGRVSRVLAGGWDRDAQARLLPARWL